MSDKEFSLMPDVSEAIVPQGIQDVAVSGGEVEEFVCAVEVNYFLLTTELRIEIAHIGLRREQIINRTSSAKSFLRLKNAQCPT